MSMTEAKARELGATPVGAFSAVEIYEIYNESYNACCDVRGGGKKSGLTVEQMNAAVGMKNSVDAAIETYNRNQMYLENGLMTGSQMYVEAGRNVHDQWCRDNFEKKYETRVDRQWQFGSSDKIGYEEFAKDIIPFTKVVLEKKGIMYDEDEVCRTYDASVREYRDKYKTQDARDAFEISHLNEIMGYEAITSDKSKNYLEAIAKAPGAADSGDERAVGLPGNVVEDEKDVKIRSTYAKMMAQREASDSVQTTPAVLESPDLV